MGRDDESRSDPEAGERVAGRAHGIARALGSAAGFVGRLSPVRLVKRLVPGASRTPAVQVRIARGVPALPRDQRPADAPPSWLPSAPEGLKPRDAGDAVPAELRAQGQALAREVREIEAELERLFAALSSAAGGLAAGADAPALIQRSRDLKQRLHERRMDLIRLERRIAREQRLQPDDPARTARAEAARRAAARRAQEAPRSTEDRPAARRRRAIREALDGASFADDSERLAFEGLAERLAGDDVDARRDAAVALGVSGAPAARALLLAAAEDPNARVRVAVLNSLGRVGGGESVAVFRRSANDADPHLRIAALRGLAVTRADQANGALIEALEDEDVAVRKSAAGMLGWRRAHEAVPALLVALRDEEPVVRAAVAEALGGVGGDRAVLSLIRAVGDDTAVVRDAALRALRAVAGPDVDGVVGGSPPEGLVASLKQWWSVARIERTLEPPAPVPGPAPALGPVVAVSAPARESAPAARAVERAVPRAAPSEPSAATRPEPPARAEPLAAAPAEPYEDILGDSTADAAEPLAAGADPWAQESGVGTYESLLEPAEGTGVSPVAGAGVEPEASEGGYESLFGEEAPLDEAGSASEPAGSNGTGEAASRASTSTSDFISTLGDEAEGEDEGAGDYESLLDGEEPAPAAPPPARKQTAKG